MFRGSEAKDLGPFSSDQLFHGNPPAGYRVDRRGDLWQAVGPNGEAGDPQASRNHALLMAWRHATNYRRKTP